MKPKQPEGISAFTKPTIYSGPRLTSVVDRDDTAFAIRRLTLLSGSAYLRDRVLRAIAMWRGDGVDAYEPECSVTLREIGNSPRGILLHSACERIWEQSMLSDMGAAVQGLPNPASICHGGVVYFRSPDEAEEMLTRWFEWVLGLMIATPRAQVVISTNSPALLWCAKEAAKWLDWDVAVHRFGPEDLQASARIVRSDIAGYTPAKQMTTDDCVRLRTHGHFPCGNLLENP